MTKQNRALKVIDKNSLPKIIDILEIPKQKGSASSNEPPNSERCGENVGTVPIRPRKRRRQPLTSSKTPKISNLAGNKNVTTRRSREKNSRPPMPNSITSATKKRKGFGSSILTPYGAQMARLKNRRMIGAKLTPSLSKSPRRMIDGKLTPSLSKSPRRMIDTKLPTSLSKSPNLLKHYDRLKPVTGNFSNEHNKQQQELEFSNSLLQKDKERNGLDQKTTINSTPSMSSIPNTNIRKLLTASSKERSVAKKSNLQENINKCKNNNYSKNDIQNSGEDMDCDSSDGLSLNSSSSSSFSSPPKKSKQLSSGSKPNQEGSIAPSSKDGHLASNREGKYQIPKKSAYSESNPKLLSGLNESRRDNLQVSASASRETTGKDDVDGTVRIHKDPSSASASAPATATGAIEDINVFNLVMGNHSNKVNNELLGSTIGDGRFFWKNIDEDSVLTTFSAVGDQKSTTVLPKAKTERVVLRTPICSLHNPESPPSVSNEQKKWQTFSPKIHYEPNEPLEEESIEAWSIDGHTSSPFFFDIGGKKYGHPTLPPGWTMRISRGESRPVYSHPDHGSTWHCPIKLTPNMMYVKTSSGKFVKQTKSSQESSKKDTCARGGSHTPKTPPSARGMLPFENENQHQVLQSRKTVDGVHFALQEEDQDSTHKLIRDISALSTRLVEKSSSNLQKVENVKTIHQNTNDLTKRVESSQQCKRFLSPGYLKPQTLSTSTSLSRSTQLNEHETPATMSAVLRQYEQTLGRCDNLITYSESHSANSKSQGVAKRRVSKIITNRRDTKELSPTIESTVNTVNNSKSDRQGNRDMLHDSTTKKKVGSKKNNHRSPSDTTPPPRLKANLLYEESVSKSENKIANRPLGNSPSNQISFMKSSNINKEPSQDIPLLQKSKNTEHIEAWFTPVVQFEEATGSVEDNINISSLEEAVVLRFGVKTKGGQPRLHTNENIAKNEELQAQRNVDFNSDSTSIKGIKIRVKHPSPLYDDEWSPLAQSHTDGDKNYSRLEGEYGSTPDSPLRDGYKPIGKVNPDLSTFKGIGTPVKHQSVLYDDEWPPQAQTHIAEDKTNLRQQQENCGSTPDSPLRHGYKPVGVTNENSSTVTQLLKEAKSGNCNDSSSRSHSTSIESHCSGRSLAKDENCNNSDPIDSGLQSTMMMKDQRLSKVKDTNVTTLVVQEAKDVLKPKQKDDATDESKNKSETFFDFGSTDAISTEVDSETLSSVEKYAQDSVTNNHEVSITTIAVQGHGTKKNSSQTDKFDTGPLKKNEQSDKIQSSVTINTGRSEASSGGDDLYGAVPGEASPNSVPVQGIRSDEDGSNLSRESIHHSKMASPNAFCGGTTTNDRNSETNIDTRSQTESEDEQSVLEISSSHDFGQRKRPKYTYEKPILHNANSSDNGSSHKLVTYDDASSCNRSFTFADDISETVHSSAEQAKRNISRTLLNEHVGCNIEDAFIGSEGESPIESPVKPTTLEKCDSRHFLQIANCDSSTESSVGPSTFDHGEKRYQDLKSTAFTSRKQNRMRYRVLNPPHPICSLQRLEELMSLKQKRQQFRTKRPRRGGRNRGKKSSSGRRRKPKHGGFR